jgi:hypothetical protein
LTNAAPEEEKAMNAESTQRKAIEARAREIVEAQAIDEERVRAGLKPLKGKSRFRYGKPFAVLTALLFGTLVSVMTIAVILVITLFF